MGPENRRSWHLDRSFSLQSLMQALFLLGAVITYFSNVERRLAVLEQVVAAHDHEITVQRQEIRDNLKEILSVLGRGR